MFVCLYVFTIKIIMIIPCNESIDSDLTIDYPLNRFDDFFHLFEVRYFGISEHPVSLGLDELGTVSF